MRNNQTNQDIRQNKIYALLQEKLEEQLETRHSFDETLTELLLEPIYNEPLPIPATSGRVPSTMRVPTRSRNDLASKNSTINDSEKNKKTGIKDHFPATTNSGVKGSKKAKNDLSGTRAETTKEKINYNEIQGYGSFDGGTTIGYYGKWRQVEGIQDGEPITEFDLLDPKLNEAKIESQEQDNGGYLVLNGIEFKVSPKSSGGPVNYKYMIESEGIKFLLHGNAKAGMQPVRVEFGFAALDGRNLYELGEKVRKWLYEIGFDIEKEVLSRVDLNATLNISPQIFFDLLKDNYFVTNAKDFSIHGYCSKTETFTCGKKIQVCVYDKIRELTKGKNGIQEAKMKAVLSHFDELKIFELLRIEFRLRRDVLNEMQIHSLDDLKNIEHDLIEFLCHWFRLISRPRTRGNTTKVKIHPLWVRVKEIFHENFNKQVRLENQKTLQFRDKKVIRCNPIYLIKQGLGCFASAHSIIKGIQDNTESTILFLWNECLKPNIQMIQDKSNEKAKYRETVNGYYSPDSLSLKQLQLLLNQIGISSKCVPALK